MKDDLITFFVTRPDASDLKHVVTQDAGRESAKRSAKRILGGNADGYVVTPLTDAGETVWTTVLPE